MSKQTIYRNAHQYEPYSQLGNSMLRDSRLSLRATGLLVHVLSLPTNWDFSLEHICHERKIGRDQSRRLLKELIAAEYCIRERERHSNGTLGRCVYKFSDDPAELLAILGQTSRRQDIGPPRPVTGSPALEIKSDYTKKEIDQNKHTKIDRFAVLGSVDKQLPGASHISERTFDEVRRIAPGHDPHALYEEWLKWTGSAKARNPHAAFIGWVKKTVNRTGHV